MGAVNKYADENVFRCFDMCDRLKNYKSDSELTEKRLFVSLAVLKDMAETQYIDEDELSESFTEKFDDSELSEEFVTEDKDKLKKEQKEEKSRISQNYDSVKRYFYDKKDGKEYGLYKKIYDELGIDLELKQEDSLAEKLDKLKLLKTICFAEKIGVYESTEYDEHRFPDIIKGKVPIIRILKNPNIDIIDGYVLGTDFADEFYIIYNNVRNLIKDADKIEAAVESIHLKWNGLVNSVKNEAAIFKSVSSGADVIHNFIMKGKHNEIEKYVSVRKREGHSDKKVGVMEQFFIKLATAKVRAELNGLIKLYTDENSDDKKSNRLSTKFLEEYMCDSFYNEYMNIEEFWNIAYKDIDAERKLKIWKLVLFNENPITETKLITKTDKLKFKNRCLKLAMIWKMEAIKENFEMRVNEWCFSLGALIQMLNSKDEFETYDKSDLKSYRSFSAAVKALDGIDKKRTPHSDAALRLYLKKRERQLFTCDELAQKTDSFIKDIYT